MPTSIPLSRIERVSLRDCWQNEATDFTPWLASEENIALLADTLGLNELEVLSQEEHVGPFRADILCVESGTGRKVLIENQLEKTNHTHLGQILTYAAGLDTVTIVWIAERFTEEHRAAIDWLNKITDKDFNFFGIEIQLIKIENSPAAPVFDIIAKPNDSTKEARNSTSSSSSENRSEVENFRYDFWSAFREYMNNNPTRLFKTQSPSFNHWMNISIGRSGFQITILVNTREQKITIQLYMSDDENKTYFDSLFNQKDDAETAIGRKLDWRRLDGKKLSTIDLSRKFDLGDETKQEEIFQWLKENIEKFVSYFKPIIKDL